MTTQAGPTIVVVDDEAPIRRFLRASLAAEGFRVVEATSAKEATKSVTQEHPEVIPLDLGLPDGDGIEVPGGIREGTRAG